MRTRRILVVALTVLAAGLFTQTPASAGAWEETLLDPPPARIEAGVTYTFGYWILQHGSYPFKGGDLGPTALRATDEQGASVDFPGTGSATDGHYSAEVVFPHDGTWTISSQHEVIMTDPNVAVVTVPGAVAITPSDMTERAPYEWGTVRPSFPPPAADAQNSPPIPPKEQTEVAPRAHTTPDDPALPMWAPVAGGAVLIGLALLLIRRFRRVNG
ncbi:hypothetical protein [Actinophytocola sp.]|uniref:hypothetical protein n=1 Tax=Actinophytocola sp. TaxID=1872138 RepID=UPI002ED52D89